MTKARRAQRTIFHQRNVHGLIVPVADINPSKAHAFVEMLLIDSGDAQIESMPGVSDEFATELMQTVFGQEIRDHILVAARDTQIARLPRPLSDADLQALQTRSTIRKSVFLAEAVKYMEHTDPIGVDTPQVMRDMGSSVRSDPLLVAKTAADAARRDEQLRRTGVQKKLASLIKHEATLDEDDQKKLIGHMVDQTTWKLAAAKKAQVRAKKAQAASLVNSAAIADVEIPKLTEHIEALRDEDPENERSAAFLALVAQGEEEQIEALKVTLTVGRSVHKQMKEDAAAEDDEVLRLDLNIQAKKAKVANHLLVKERDTLEKSSSKLRERSKARLAKADAHELSIKSKTAALCTEAARDVLRLAEIKARQITISGYKNTLKTYAAKEAMDETA